VFPDPNDGITESRKKGIQLEKMRRISSVFFTSFQINTLIVCRYSILEIKTTLAGTIPSVISLHVLMVIIFVSIALRLEVGIPQSV
jgi:hypothetical protein